MFPEHIFVVVGFMGALSALLTIIRPLNRVDPFWI